VNSRTSIKPREF